MNPENKIKHWKHWFDLWISGVVIQVEGCNGKWLDVAGPTGFGRTAVPSFNVSSNYRVKPREFEEGAFYLVLRDFKGTSFKDVAVYENGDFYLTGIPEIYEEKDFLWISEALDPSLWDKENGKT